MPIIHRTVKVSVAPPKGKKSKSILGSIERLKEEYYDFFNPDPDSIIHFKQTPTSKSTTKVKLKKPLVDVANTTKPHPIIKQATASNRSSPPTAQSTKVEPEDDDVILLKQPPSRAASPTKEKVVIDLAKEEKKEEQAHAFVNPHWKVDMSKHDRSVGFQSVWRRVESLNIQPFPLPPHLAQDQDFLNAHVSRSFLVSLFGGSCQATYPLQGVKKPKRPGYDNLMCLNLVWNPRAPQRVGYPGLFYESGLGNDGRVHRVLVRIQVNVWLYVGNYVMVKAEPLTKGEWLDNTQDTKNIWAEKTCTAQWGDGVRARIALRKRLARDPTKQEVKAEPEAGMAVTPADVMAAFDSGEEHLEAWVMKCIGYEEAFQRELAEGMKTYVKPVKKPKVEKPATKETKKRKRLTEESEGVAKTAKKSRAE